MPTVPAGQIGAHNLTLTANTVTEVDFADDVDTVEVLSDGTAPVYVTVDGSSPTVGGANCYLLPAAIGAKELHPPTAGGTVVKLISAGTPTVSVAKV
ncbi:hypothetical protein GCM10010174_61710 [Kutzneria viridogrisea]|uniref:Uncharacterized protein n=1 Tax=Kutzneria viridogrisea TaxID=47990 RepID=A0ABR6BGB8_9PSEU|nr:hypothetical protein [Kutzneria viridogrisea]